MKFLICAIAAGIVLLQVSCMDNTKLTSQDVQLSALEKTEEAMHRMEQGDQFGKIILQISK